MKRLSMLGLVMVMIFLAFSNAVALEPFPQFPPPPAFDEESGWVKIRKDFEQTGPITSIIYLQQTESGSYFGAALSLTDTSEIIAKMWEIENREKKPSKILSALKMEDGGWMVREGLLGFSRENKAFVIAIESYDRTIIFEERAFPELLE